MERKYPQEALQRGSDLKQSYHKEGNKALWSEVEKLLNVEGFNLKCNENFRCAVKRYEAQNGILKTKQEYKSQEIENKLNDIDMQIIEIKKEKVKLRDERSKLNKLIRESARKDNLQDIIKDCVKLISTEKPLIHTDKHYPKSTNKAGILQLSDWHYSLFVDNFLNKYNLDIFKQRVNDVLNKTINYIKDYNVECLYVLLQGDFISSSIKDCLRIYNQEDIISQIQATSEVISEVLNELSNHISIKVCIVEDNHSRVTEDKKKSISEENYMRITEWYLKTRLNNNRNIHFNDSKYGMDISGFKVYDYKCAMVHGHRDKFKDTVSNLTLFTREIYDFIFTSHYHHPMFEEQNMTMVIGNGSLVGVDHYASSLRLTSFPSQNFVVISKDNGLEAICPMILK